MNSREARRAAVDALSPVWRQHGAPDPMTWSADGEAYASVPVTRSEGLPSGTPRRVEAFDLHDGTVRVSLRVWLGDDSPHEARCSTPDDVRALVSRALAHE